MIDIIIDGQWGSSGKGKLSQYLQDKNKYDIVCISARPNAGHTFFVGDKEMCFHQLPVSGFDPDVKDILIGPGSVLNPETVKKELAQIEHPERVMIDWRAAIIDDVDVASEEKNLRGISSTLQGTGAAQARKIMRDETAIACYKGEKFWEPARLGDTIAVMRKGLRDNESILMESTQGFELSINAAPFYPFCTSHDITPAGILAPWGVHWTDVDQIWGTCRVYPIRVGSLSDGYSGDVYKGQKELEWQEVMERCGHPGPVEDFRELTSTTKRIRRIFEWSWEQWDTFEEACVPHNLFISHLDHIDMDVYGKGGRLSKITDSEKSMKWLLEFEDNASIFNEILLGTGPKLEHMIKTDSSEISSNS